jgi:MFS family permease
MTPLSLEKTSEDTLFSFEFIILSLIAFLAFCNISMFYGFNAYLEHAGVPAVWRGVLISLEPFTAFALRPLVSTFISPRNGIRIMGLGLLILALSLGGYSLAQDIRHLVLVRICHGLGFVLLVSAVIHVLVLLIPKKRSGQGFGVFTVMTLLPYAILPPLMERLLPWAQSEVKIYVLGAPLFLAALLLLLPLSSCLKKRWVSLPAEAMKKPGFQELVSGLKHPGVLSLLWVNFLVFTATTMVFFYMKDHLLALGASNPGLFFTLTTAATLWVRIFCGKFMDGINRAGMLLSFLCLLAFTLCFFSLSTAPVLVLGLALFYGMVIGFLMPQLNAFMFDISLVHLKGMNSNLMLFAMDGGFFMGPLLAGFLLGAGVSYAGLFFLFALLPAMGMLWIWSIRRLAAP